MSQTLYAQLEEPLLDEVIRKTWRVFKSEWKEVQLGDHFVKHGYAFKGDDFSENNLKDRLSLR